MAFSTHSSYIKLSTTRLLKTPATAIQATIYTFSNFVVPKSFFDVFTFMLNASNPSSNLFKRGVKKAELDELILFRFFCSVLFAVESNLSDAGIVY